MTKHTHVTLYTCGMSSNLIRRIPPGQQIPSHPPRRYIDSHGYVILRWKVGVGQYVEALEHRVVDGRITTAPVVHHRDHNKQNNAPANLEHIDAAAHGSEHRRIDRQRVLELYRQGWTTPEIGREVGTNHGNVWRMVEAAGERRGGYQQLRKDVVAREPDIVEALRAGAPRNAIARELNCAANVIELIAKRHDLPARRPGRPPASHTHRQWLRPDVQR